MNTPQTLSKNIIYLYSKKVNRKRTDIVIKSALFSGSTAADVGKCKQLHAVIIYCLTLSKANVDLHH